jgi:sugar phosphate permease
VPVARARAWLLWTTAIVVYIAAVFHRSSLGVAGLQATERFGVGPAALSTFTVLQVAVYAAMQIPTGLLADRFGPRRVLVAAALLLGTGEILFGIAHSYPLALLARGVLGMGDAMTFVSVLRVVAATFRARMYPLIVALTSMLGGVGNLVATVPLTLLLASTGWTATFLAAGLLTAGYAAVVGTTLRVPATRSAEPAVRGTILRGALSAWRVPGTRLGFWVHFSTMATPTTLGLLWGYPYLVQAQHLDAVRADETLGALVIGGIVANPVLGAVTSRYRSVRMPLVAGYLVIAVATWVPLLVVPGRLPFLVLLAAFVVFAVGGPMSAIGFALARDYNPVNRVGTATGVVNVGGFLATTMAALGVGVLVQATGSYRLGLLAVFLVVTLGMSRVAVWWRRARAAAYAAQHRGEDVPVRVTLGRWDGLARQRRGRPRSEATANVN